MSSLNVLSLTKAKFITTFVLKYKLFCRLKQRRCLELRRMIPTPAYGLLSALAAGPKT
jgi:hypothetical protein